jgi:putative transposase
MKDKDYSQRRACVLVGLQPKTYRYVSKRPDDAPIRQRLRELALERRRFGYRRLHILLRREGIVLNRKKLYRLYREERLMVRRRGGRKRALGTRAPLAIPGIEPALVAGLRLGRARLRAEVPRVRRCR